MVCATAICSPTRDSTDIPFPGAFQIYRAPGSVAFLRCGSALQPILPKSQAWCLEEDSSKFVLQIRRPNYWRIEVPVGNSEEVRRALLLRDVFEKILQFEKTPCPFERNFAVELPERPKTPIKKRAWTPPARTVSLNWPPGPPGHPITPPPEFPSRTRFYNPGARRFSDVGVDTSKLSLTPAASPQKAARPIEEAAENGETPSRWARAEESAMMCKPLLEEPEPLSPPLTAIPPSIAQVAEQPAPQTPGLPKSQLVTKPAKPTILPATSNTRTVEAPAKKREPIWITKKVPSSANRKVKRTAIEQTQSAGPVVSAAPQPVTAITPSHPEHVQKMDVRNTDGLTASAQTVKFDAQKKLADDEVEAVGGALEGSGQLQIRRTRLAAYASRRAATAPPLKLRTSSSTLNGVQERSRTPTPERVPEEPVDPSSPTESLDSFHSVQSWHSPLSPPASSPIFSSTKTFPYPHENIPLRPSRTGQTLELVTTPTVSGTSIRGVAGSGGQSPNTPFSDVHENEIDPAAGAVFAPKTSENEVQGGTNLFARAPKEDAEEDVDAISDTDSVSASWSSAESSTSFHSNTPMRHRAATTSVAISHRSPRALSPLPPAANLLTTDLASRSSSTARVIRRIPSSIFNKTCEILISPPAHLISLMLKVAARITAGEWQGFVFGLDEAGEVVDVRWDYDDVDGPLPGGWAESELDIGGHALRHQRARTSFAAADVSRPARQRRKSSEYQDPWASPPEEPDMDDEEHWSRSWGVD